MMTMTNTLAFLGPIGWQELVILAVLGLLIFGKRLPEVGKSLGKGIVEFKKGLSGIEDDIDKATTQNPKQIEGGTTQHEMHAESNREPQPDRPA